MELIVEEDTYFMELIMEDITYILTSSNNFAVVYMVISFRLD